MTETRQDIEPAEAIWAGVSAVLAIGAGVIWMVLVATGTIGNVGGDASIRLTYANLCLEDGPSCIGQITRGPWPPGQGLMLAPAVAIGGALGLDAATAGAIAAVLAFTVSGLLVRRMAAAIGGATAGAVAVAAFVSFGVVSRYASNTYGEIFALPFVVGAAAVFVDDRERGRPTRWWLVGGLVLLAATIRTEALIVALLLAAFEFPHDRRRAVLLAVVASAYTALSLVIGSSDDSFGYAEIGEWYSFSSGRDSLPEIRDTLELVVTDPHPLYGFGLLVALVTVLAARGVPKVALALVGWVTLVIAAVAFLGMAKSTPRYYLWSAVFAAVVVGQAVAFLAVRAGPTYRHLVAASAVAGLLVGAVAEGSATVDRYEGFERESVVELRAWLIDEVPEDAAVFYDFIRFYGAYLRAERQPAGQVGDDFDYSSFYTGVPYGPGRRVPVAEVPANVQIREHGRAHLVESCPDYVVVATNAWLRRIEIENPDIIMVGSDLPDTVEVGTSVEWSAGSARLDFTWVFANTEFGVLRTDSCTPV